MSDVQRNLIRDYAEVAAKTVTDQVITVLKSCHDTLSGDDSGPANVWEEICAQVQGEESVGCDAYIQVIEVHVLTILETLSEQDRSALWLQTDNGRNWHSDVENTIDNDVTYRSESEVPSLPYDMKDAVDYVIGQYVLPSAENYSNSNIDRYLRNGDSDEEEDEEDSELQLLIELIPPNTMVTDLWDWDIHFENESFIDITKADFENDEAVSQYAESLANDFLGWIDKYDMDYNQQGWPPGEFESWIKEQCLKFMQAWRQNVKNEFNR